MILKKYTKHRLPLLRLEPDQRLT